MKSDRHQESADSGHDRSRRGEQGEQNQEGGANTGDGKNWLEWVVFAAGAVLTLGTLGYLVYSAMTLEDVPPQLEVTLGAPEPRPEGYAVPVTVENVGNRTAEDVQLMLTLELPNGQKEEATLVFAFVPQQSTQNGWSTFSQNPAAGNLKASVVSYTVP